MRRKKYTQGLFLGTITLLISNIFVKGLGFAYRVAQVRILGAYGVGLIEMVTPLFSFLLVLAGCGIQPALSQSIAGHRRNEQRTYFKAAVTVLMISGTLVSALSIIFAPLIIDVFAADERIAECFYAIIPAILIISVASAWRGLLQGRRQVSTIGMSQNIEQLIRVGIGIYLTSRLVGYGIGTAAAGVSVATVCGELAGFLYLLYSSKKAPKLSCSGQISYFKAAVELIKFGIPITVTKLSISAIMMLQAFLIPLCLQKAGWDTNAATEIYGRFSGVAFTLFHLPGVFTSALSVSVLPAVASSAANIDNKSAALERQIKKALQATVICTLPGMAALWLFSDALCTGLFNNAPAAEILRLITIPGIFFYLQVTLSSILQGLGEVNRLLINNIITGLIMLTGIWLLTSMPALGINGAAIALGLSWIAGCLFNIYSIYTCTNISLPWKDIMVKPLIALAASSAVYIAISKLCGLSTETSPATGILLFAASLVLYLVILLSSGSISFSKNRHSAD